MKLELKKFDMPNLKDDAVVIYVAPRNQGKSTLLFDTLFYHKDIPIGVVISGTESANHCFEPFVPKMLVYDEYTPEIIEKFLDRQVKISNQYLEEKKKYGKTDIDPRAFLILDDCMFDSSWTKDKNMRYLFLNGRHVHVFLLITMQYPLGIPPAMRANVDYVFICKNNMIKEREKIYNQYAGMFPSMDVFGQVMDQCTENFECIVINKRTVSNALNEQVFWYKAKVGHKFRLCSQEIWNMQRVDEERRSMGLAEEIDPDDDYNPSVMRPRKNQPKIRVKRV
jgi:frataxin-like iron-binding protein CyaY